MSKTVFRCRPMSRRKSKALYAPGDVVMVKSGEFAKGVSDVRSDGLGIVQCELRRPGYRRIAVVVANDDGARVVLYRPKQIELAPS